MSEHSLLSASSADRWLACPISVIGTDPNVAGRAAAEGTLGHTIAENVLRGLPWPALGSEHTVEGFEFTITSEFLTDVNAYVQFIQTKPWLNGFNVEAKVNYARSLGVPHNLAFGTSDNWGFTTDPDGRVLEVIDLKMGRRAVSPTNNPQAIMYVGGVLDALYPALVLARDHRVRVTIFQPRLSYRPFEWLTTVGTIQDALLTSRPAAAAAVAYHNKTATMDTWAQFPEMLGDHCRYCPRKSQCAAFQGKLREVAQPAKTVVWDEDLYRLADTIRLYLEDMESMALERAMDGHPLPGTKLVQGRNGNPKVLLGQPEVRAIAKKLGVEKEIVWTEEVWATPAKVRDAFKRIGMAPADLAKVIATPEGAPKLALADDPRPEVRRGADTSVFHAQSI